MDCIPVVFAGIAAARFFFNFGLYLAFSLTRFFSLDKKDRISPNFFSLGLVMASSNYTDIFSGQ